MVRLRWWPSALMALAACQSWAATPADLSAGFDARPEEGRKRVVEALGYLSRAEAAQRDAAVLELAALLRRLGPDGVAPLQREFEAALLLVCDRDIYPTLAPATVATVDDAIEGCFTLDDLSANGKWDPLAYAWGFFNTDVTAADIRRVADGWAAIPKDQRGPHYPTYVHLIDAVCKPLAYVSKDDVPAATAALEAGLPLLKGQLEQPVEPGTAFHPPSHAALDLGPIYDHFAGDPRYEAVLQRQLGTRDDLIQALAALLPGAQATPMDLNEVEYRFRFYAGRYAANALARLDARQVVPALQRTLEVCAAKGAPAPTVAYTRRALMALGDAALRAEATTPELLWLARNGGEEARGYAVGRLRELLPGHPEDPVAAGFAAQLADALATLGFGA